MTLTLEIQDNHLSSVRSLVADSLNSRLTAIERALTVYGADSTVTRTLINHYMERLDTMNASGIYASGLGLGVWAFPRPFVTSEEN